MKSADFGNDARKLVMEGKAKSEMQAKRMLLAEKNRNMINQAKQETPQQTLPINTERKLQVRQAIAAASETKQAAQAQQASTIGAAGSGQKQQTKQDVNVRVTVDLDKNANLKVKGVAQETQHNTLMND